MQALAAKYGALIPPKAMNEFLKAQSPAKSSTKKRRRGRGGKKTTHHNTRGNANALVDKHEVYQAMQNMEEMREIEKQLMEESKSRSPSKSKSKSPSKSKSNK
jgi:hypothetical protein